MVGKSERINEILRKLCNNSTDIFGAAIVSLDGFLISSVTPSEIDEELVSGMSAVLLGAGERISNEMMHSPLNQIFVKSEKGYVIINSIGHEAVLVILVNGEGKLGLIFLELKKIVSELQKIL